MRVTAIEPVQITKFLTSKNPTFTEAFSSGKGGWVVGKLASVINKRVGKHVAYSRSPIDYQNTYGKFSGYLLTIDRNILVRINFKLGSSSDSIQSVDYYNIRHPSIPVYTVDMDGLNIVQVVDELVTNLPDDELRSIAESIETEGKRLLEKFDDERRMRIFMDWFNSDPNVNLKLLTDKPLSVAYNQSFLHSSEWAKEIPFYFFTLQSKNFLSSRGVRNKTFRNRKKGSKERVVEDPEQEQMLQDIVDNMGWEKKFEMLDNAVKMIVKGIVHSLVIFGDPGSGKSREVETVLTDLHAPAVFYKGTIKGTEELLRILYNHKDGKILVFDDFDTVFKSQDNILIFKAILENKPKRQVVSINLKNFTGGAKLKKTAVPAKFDFSSGVIFISNMRKFDPAILSRSINIRVDLTNDQMIDKLNKTMDSFHPEVPMQLKSKAIDFLKEISKGIRTVDYRQFEIILATMQISPNDWKEMALLMMTSQ